MAKKAKHTDADKALGPRSEFAGEDGQEIDLQSGLTRQADDERKQTARTATTKPSAQASDMPIIRRVARDESAVWPMLLSLVQELIGEVLVADNGGLAKAEHDAGELENKKDTFRFAFGVAVDVSDPNYLIPVVTLSYHDGMVESFTRSKKVKSSTINGKQPTISRTPDIFDPVDGEDGEE